MTAPTPASTSTGSGASMRLARIDLDAIADNVRRCRASEVDVSGDAYGHGAVQTAAASIAGGAKTLIAPDEDLRMLRAAGITADLRTPSDRDGPLAESATDVYGVGPRAASLGLRPAMRVSAHVIGVKTIDAGEPVSYGYTWRASVRSTLALVPLGYADGLARSAGNRGWMRLDGTFRPIVGRVAMDVVVLDLGADETLLGAEAVLFGDPASGDPSAEQWAVGAGMTALEATAAMGPRIPRTWISTSEILRSGTPKREISTSETRGRPL